jgi:hypothetical protein
MRLIAVAALGLAIGQTAAAQLAAAQPEAQDSVYENAGVSFAYRGWERFDPPQDREGELISVRLLDPLRVCTLARVDFRRGGDNSDQGWLNERMIERAESFAQTMRHAGTITSTETMTVDGVAVIDAEAVGVEPPQPDRSHDRFFAVRHEGQIASYRLDCLVFGTETPADRAAVDALMNSLHFDRTNQ